jgi:hypothetical protein
MGLSELDYAALGVYDGVEQKAYIREWLGNGPDVAHIKDVIPENTRATGYLFNYKPYISVTEDTYDKTDVARRIFARALYKVFERVVDGDVFISPKQDKFYVRSVPDHIVRQLRQDGHYLDYNLQKTNFTLPQVVCEPYCKLRKIRGKSIALPTLLRTRLRKNLEEGKLKLPKVLFDKLKI